jgi:hypothetical protein
MVCPKPVWCAPNVVVLCNLLEEEGTGGPTAAAGLGFPLSPWGRREGALLCKIYTRLE